LPSAAVSTCTTEPLAAVTVINPESTLLSPALLARILPVPDELPLNTALLLSTDATKSALTTPPVAFWIDQASAATLPTKFPAASRPIEYTVIELPEVMLCAGTIVPLPLAAVSTRTCVALPALTVMTPESTLLNPVLLARILPVPTRLPVKVALLLSPDATKSALATPPVPF